MVNFRDPAVVNKNYRDLVKFSNVVDGIFFWEFLTTLDYEWSVIKGHRPYRWTIWVYSLTRVAAFAVVTLDIILLDTAPPIGCQLQAALQFTVAYLALALASLLILLRTIAIWNRDRIVVAIAAGTWGISIMFFIQGVSRIRFASGPNVGLCLFVEIKCIALGNIAALVTDVVLILIMLLGLFRMRRDAGGSMALGRLLWNQGVIWLILATLAEVPPTVFIFLNLNDPLDVMFQVPWLTTMTIAATWMYRSLSDFGSSNVYISDELLPVQSQPMSEIRCTRAIPTPLPCIRVAVHAAHERYPSS